MCARAIGPASPFDCWSHPDFSRLVQMESLLVGCSKFFCTYHKCVARHVYSFAPSAPDMLVAPIWKATILGRTDLTTWHANSACSLPQEIKVLLSLGSTINSKKCLQHVNWFKTKCEVWEMISAISPRVFLIKLGDLLHLSKIFYY